MFLDNIDAKGKFKIYTRKVGEENWNLKISKKNLVVDTGLNLLRDLITGDSTDTLGYCALGSGTTSITSTDTYLEEEVWRNTFVTTTTSTSKRIVYETFFSSLQANGDGSISNAGLFVDDATLLEDGETVTDWADTNDATSSADSTIYQNGSKSMKIALVNAAGNGEVTKTTSIGDVSGITGVSSGKPTEGRARVLVYCDAVANLNGTNAIQLKLGSGAADYSLFNLDDSELTDDTWYLWDIDLTSGSETGTPDWTAMDYQQITVNETGNVNVYIDDIQMFGGKMFNAQTFTAFSKTRTVQVLVNWTIEFLDN